MSAGPARGGGGAGGSRGGGGAGPGPRSERSERSDRGGLGGGRGPADAQTLSRRRRLRIPPGPLGPARPLGLPLCRSRNRRRCPPDCPADNRRPPRSPPGSRGPPSPPIAAGNCKPHKAPRRRFLRGPVAVPRMACRETRLPPRRKARWELKSAQGLSSQTPAPQWCPGRGLLLPLPRAGLPTPARRPSHRDVGSLRAGRRARRHFVCLVDSMYPGTSGALGQPAPSTTCAGGSGDPAYQGSHPYPSGWVLCYPQY